MEIRTAYRAANQVTGSKEQAVIEELSELIQGESAASSAMRMAPDATFDVELADGPHTFELLGNRSVLRDEGTQRVWTLPQGSLLRSIA